MNRIFEVEIVHRIYVSAETPGQAESWAEAHSNIWDADAPESILAKPVTVETMASIPADVRDSLPWAAGSVPDDEMDKTVQWMVNRNRE